MVDVADDQQSGFVGDRRQQRPHQHDIHHRGLVDDQKSAVERIVGVAFEPSAPGIDLKQPVDRHGLEPGGLRHPFGCAAGRRAKQQGHALGVQDTQDGVDDGRLAHARTAGDDHGLGVQGPANRLGLAFRKRQAGLPLDPGQRLAGIDIRPGQPAARDLQKPFADRPFGPVQATKKNTGGSGNRVRNDRSLGQFEVQSGLNQLLRDFQQFDGERRKLCGGKAAMAVVHRLGQRMGNPRANPDHGRLFDAEFHGDRVRGLEPDAANVAGKAVRVLGHDLNGIHAVGLVDPHRARRADAMAVQEHHDLPDDLLLGPGVGDAFGANPADAGHLAQPFRLRLDDVEHLLTERPDHLPGIDRPDAADHAGAEVFLDALDRRWLRGAHEARLELLTMGAVVDPFPRCGYPLPGRDHGGVADDRHEIAMAACLDAQNAKPVIGIVERHSLDEASQNLPVRRFRLPHSRPAHDVPSILAVNNSLIGSNCRVRSKAAAGFSKGASSSSMAARSFSRRSRSMRARCTTISCAVNICLTRETNRGSSRANSGCWAAASAKFRSFSATA